MSLTFTIDQTVQLATEECGVCGVAFALPTAMRDRCLADYNRHFYCPNGHYLHYIGQTEAEKLRLENERLTHRLDQAKADADFERKQHIAAKGQITRLKKRADNGLCLECNRSFADLAGHMADKHDANKWAKHSKQNLTKHGK